MDQPFKLSLDIQDDNAAYCYERKDGDFGKLPPDYDYAKNIAILEGKWARLDTQLSMLAKQGMNWSPAQRFDADLKYEECLFSMRILRRIITYQNALKERRDAIIDRYSETDRPALGFRPHTD